MKAVIVCVSESHGNTKRIADVMAEVLGASVVDPSEVDMAELAASDIVGFGSGIFSMAFHPRLREFVRSLPAADRGKAFVFATSGFPVISRPLVKLLEQRGREVVDMFSCRGWDTFLPFKPFGGVQKGHPDAADLEAARVFAEGLRTRLTATA